MHNRTNTDIIPFNRDRLFMLAREDVATDAHLMLDRINDIPAERQMAAAAMMFHVLCSRFGLEPWEMHYTASKMLRPEKFHKKGNSQVEALEAYANLHKTGHF